MEPGLWHIFILHVHILGIPHVYRVWLYFTSVSPVYWLHLYGHMGTHLSALLIITNSHDLLQLLQDQHSLSPADLLSQMNWLVADRCFSHVLAYIHNIFTIWWKVSLVCNADNKYLTYVWYDSHILHLWMRLHPPMTGWIGGNLSLVGDLKGPCVGVVWWWWWWWRCGGGGHLLHCS